jgi:hypothetical protein
MLECLKINCSLERLPYDSSLLPLSSPSLLMCVRGFQGTSGFYKIPMALEENRKYKVASLPPFPFVSRLCPWPQRCVPLSVCLSVCLSVSGAGLHSSDESCDEQ